MTVDHESERVYLAGSRGAAAISQTGEVTWTVDLECRIVPPVVRDDQVILPGNDGTLLAVDPTDGTEHWELSLPGPLHTIAPTTDGVFVADGDGGLQLYVL
jgi:outer membrane protein assembly factor BamB